MIVCLSNKSLRRGWGVYVINIILIIFIKPLLKAV